MGPDKAQVRITMQAVIKAAGLPVALVILAENLSKKAAALFFVFFAGIFQEFKKVNDICRIKINTGLKFS
jgi:hypothetical protein